MVLSVLSVNCWLENIIDAEICTADKLLCCGCLKKGTVDADTDHIIAVSM